MNTSLQEHSLAFLWVKSLCFQHSSLTSLHVESPACHIPWVTSVRAGVGWQKGRLVLRLPSALWMAPHMLLVCRVPIVDIYELTIIVLWFPSSLELIMKMFRFPSGIFQVLLISASSLVWDMWVEYGLLFGFYWNISLVGNSVSDQIFWMSCRV